MKLNIIAVLLLLVAASLIFWQASNTNKTHRIAQTQTSEKPAETKKTFADTEHEIDLRITQITPNEKELSDLKKPSAPRNDYLSGKPSWQAMQQKTSVVINNGHTNGPKSLFTIDHTNQQPKPTNLDFSLHGKPISINENSIKNLKEKQLIKLPLDQHYSFLVKKINRKRDGSVTLNLSLPGKSKIYRAFINIGKKATFGRIITPEGGYELEAINGKGWIVDTRHIDTRMPEDGIDYLIPKFNS